MPQPSPKKPQRDQGSSEFNISELIDLALCSPEVGAVNFNILRMVLKNIVKKMGIDKEPANVNDVEANQVEKFKDYVDGSSGGTGTPMPGVLKIGPSQTRTGAPSGGSDKSGPGASQQQGQDGLTPPQQQRGKSVSLPPPLPQQQGQQSEPRGQQGQTPRTPNAGGRPSQSNVHSHDPRLAEKVAKLEKHLEALYQLPTNNEILERAKSGAEGMSVSDMWQIIQLNNRIAAAEAAIQKMASLIEDLAKSMGRVKNDTKGIKKEAEDLQNRKSDLEIQGQELTDKYDKFSGVVNQLQKDVDQLKRGWKKDRDNIEKALGTDLGKVPSFMKGKQGQQETARQQQQPENQQGQSRSQRSKSQEQDQPRPQQQQKPRDQSRQPQSSKTPTRVDRGTGGGGPTAKGREGGRGSDGETGSNEGGRARPSEGGRSRGSQPGPGADESDYDDNVPSEQFERGTQTFVPANDADKGKPQASGGGRKSQGPSSQQKRSQSQGNLGQSGGQQRESPRQAPQAQGEQRQKQAAPEKQRQKQAPAEGKRQSQPSRRQKPVDEMIPPEEIARMTPFQIAEQVTPEEARNIPPETYRKMSDEQKRAVNEARQGGAAEPEPKKPPLGVKNMAKEEIKEISPEKIAEMPYEEAATLRPEVIENMDEGQKKVLQKVIERGPSPLNKKITSRRDVPGSKPQSKRKSTLGVVTMDPEDIQEIAPATIVEEMSYEEAKTLPPQVLEKMTPAQKVAVKKVVEAGPPRQQHQRQSQQRQEKAQSPKTSIGVANMSNEELEYLKPEEIETGMPYEEAKAVPSAVLEKMTPEQQEAVKHVVEAGPEPTVDDDYDDEDYYEPSTSQQPAPKQKSVSQPPAKSKRTSEPLTKQEIKNIARIPAKDLSKSITPQQAASIPQDELEQMFSPNQIKEIEQIREQRNSGAEGALELGQESGPEGYMDDAQDQFYGELQPTTDYDETEEAIGTGKIQKKGIQDQLKQTPSQHKEKHKHHHHHHHHGGETEEEIAAQQRHTPIEILEGPIPKTGEPLPLVTLEDYLSTLSPEEAANLASETVQRELQKQYQHLQGMQRKLATDIQDKMEYIYQKLMKEIAAQQMTTTPYMSVGGPEECLGPGVCTGYGMPAGIAVCQFPEAKDKKGALPDGKVCPGPGVCPGSDVCSYCRADGNIQVLKKPDRKSVVDDAEYGTGELYPGARPVTDMGGALQEMKSLVMLDLEKIREEMRSKQFGAYDEQDILERLSAVWEALKIMQRNEEALAVKISRQDAFFKKIPAKTIEKLHKIPDANLDALATGDFQKPMYVPDGSRRSNRDADTLRSSGYHSSPPVTASGDDKEDIQSIFNNLANVIAECAEQKDKIDQLSDTARILESAMVTKQMLLDVMSDKADAGIINTKVSYDEFGSTIDELHNQLHNLMVEGYQRNENWKKVTSDMAEDLAAKLDKTALAPIQAFFKTHLKMLEEKVKNVTDLMEEPDSAGTRKKLLRDYNCLSCDRVVNISGVTHGPTLPIIGPIPAGHATASKRALDLHRMRMLKRIDPNNKNLNALEKQGRGIRSRANQKGAPADANDMDVMSAVNRYTGGSHTNVTNADLIAAQRRKTSTGIEAAAGVGQRLSNSVDISEADTATTAPPPTADDEPIIAAIPSFEMMIIEE